MRYFLATLLALLAAPAYAAPADPWWRHAVIYEIYPRSFQDSNGDGVGDLNGITERLDYLQELGVDAIWLTPIYPSPQVDFGYDISDYTAIDPQFGTLADFDRLVAEAKRRHIRVLMDLVLNHTSDQHAWFKAASRSRTDPKHDWYVWNDGKPGAPPLPPNNWVSLFGGSAWQWVPSLKQFYYHEFYRQQPDLNFANPAVEQAMLSVMRFWLDRGVAGYRLDAVPHLFEDPQLRDEPPLGGTNAQGDPKLAHVYTSNLPRVHDVVRRMRALVAKYPGDRVLVGETYLPSIAALAEWYGGAQQDELQLPMDMQLAVHEAKDGLDAARFRRHLVALTTQLNGGQPLLVIDNHDNPRSWDRYADGVHDAAIARVLATMLLTTPATALLYYGEELGMRTTPPIRKADVRDPIGITGWPKEKGRDGERTPMQWDASNAQAGFSTHASWLPVPGGFTSLNVQAERADPGSLLSWHRKLIALRRMPALRDGRITMLDEQNPSVLTYLRTAGKRSVLVALNMTAQPQQLALPQAITTLLTDDPALEKVRTATLTIAPYASLVAELR